MNDKLSGASHRGGSLIIKYVMNDKLSGASHRGGSLIIKYDHRMS